MSDDLIENRQQASNDPKYPRARPLGKTGRVQSSYLLSLAQSATGTKHVTSPKTTETKAAPASVILRDLLSDGVTPVTSKEQKAGSENNRSQKD